MFDDDVALHQAAIIPRKETMALAEVHTEQIFPFLGLPPELREMIYKPLINAGDVSILRVSKLVSQEAVPLLSSIAYLRVNIGSHCIRPVTFNLTADIASSGHVTLTAPEHIQHVEFYINMADRTRLPLDPKLIHCFSGNMVTRKTCVITIVLGSYTPVPHKIKDDEIYRAISALTGFRDLFLILEHERDAIRHARILRRYGRPQSIEVTRMMHRFHLYDYETVVGFLTLTLGPAEFNKSIDGHFIGFMPRKYEDEGREALMRTLRGGR